MKLMDIRGIQIFVKVCTAKFKFSPTPNWNVIWKYPPLVTKNAFKRNFVLKITSLNISLISTKIQNVFFQSPFSLPLGENPAASSICVPSSRFWYIWRPRKFANRTSSVLGSYLFCSKSISGSGKILKVREQTFILITTCALSTVLNTLYNVVVKNIGSGLELPRFKFIFDT